MTSGPLDLYLRELARALHERGHEASRIVDEAREHLVDAVEDGLRRGLAREDAEREAVERFGPPELIAAQAPIRSHMMARLTVALDTVVGHWRWITAATAVAALLTSLASYYWLPARYRSETVILVSRVAALEPGDSDGRRTREHLRSVIETVLSPPRLEQLVKEYGLDARQEAVRRNISIEVVTPEQPVAGPDTSAFKVSFQSPNPQLSKNVTEHMAAWIIAENMQRHEQAHPGDDAARRTFGAQFRVVEPARVPDGPVSPNLAKAGVSGAFAGLALSIGALIFRRPAR